MADPTVVAALYGAGAALLGAVLATVGSAFASNAGRKTAVLQLEADRVKHEMDQREARMVWWRERRLAAHERFFGELLTAEGVVFTFCEAVERASKYREAGPAQQPVTAVFGGLSGARSALTLVGGARVGPAAGEAYAALKALYLHYAHADSAAEMGLHDVYSLDERSTKPMWERTGTAKAEYLDAAKAELGSTE